MIYKIVPATMAIPNILEAPAIAMIPTTESAQRSKRTTAISWSGLGRWLMSHQATTKRKTSNNDTEWLLMVNRLILGTVNPGMEMIPSTHSATRMMMMISMGELYRICKVLSTWCTGLLHIPLLWVIAIFAED